MAVCCGNVFLFLAYCRPFQAFLRHILNDVVSFNFPCYLSEESRKMMIFLTREEASVYTRIYLLLHVPLIYIVYVWGASPNP